MSHSTERHLNQTAVYWECVARDRFSDPVLAPPDEIPIRWEWTRMEIIDVTGQSVQIDAMVCTGQRLREGSLLYLGDLNQYQGVGSGSTHEGNVLEVVRYQEATDVRGSQTRRESLLRRHKKKG